MFGRKGKTEEKKSQSNDDEIKKQESPKSTESIPKEKKSRFSMLKLKSGTKDKLKSTESIPKEKKSKFSMLKFKSGNKEKSQSAEVITDWNKYKASISP